MNRPRLGFTNDCRPHVIIFIMVVVYFIYDFTMMVCYGSESAFGLMLVKKFFWVSYLGPFQYHDIGPYLYGGLLLGLIYSGFYFRHWMLRVFAGCMFFYFLFFWAVTSGSD